jgi:hypothetical protein
MDWDNNAVFQQTQLVYEYFRLTLGEDFIAMLQSDKSSFKSDLELAEWLETNFWSRTYEYYYDSDSTDPFPKDLEDSKKSGHLKDTLFELVSLLEINFHLIAERLLNE